MVDRYKSSTAVPTAQIAAPRSSPLSDLAGATRDLAQTATSEAMRKVEERNAALESASLNAARLELQKQGGQLALDLQKDRVAGSNYVKDLEAARAPLKKNIWATLPTRIQNSARAQMAWDDVWTSDEMSSQRAAVGWQSGQEKEYTVQTIDNSLAAIAAKVEVDPDSASAELENWSKTIPTYSGLLDQETLAKAQTTGVQTILQGTVRGMAKQGRFDEARKLVVDAGAKLDPQQRKAFESVIEDAENDIEREQLKQEKELREGQTLYGNQREVDILDGKYSRQQLDADVSSGKINENDKPVLIRALRAENDRRKTEAEQAKLSAAEKEALKDRTEDFKLAFDAYATHDPAGFMAGSWSNAMREKYALMTPDGQRYIDRKQIEMGQAGQTTSVAKTVFGSLMDEAKRVAPAWDIGSNAKNPPKEGQEFAGKLYATAERIAAENGGKDLTVQQVRDAVARALDAYQPGKWDSLPTNAYDTAADGVNARLKSAVDPNYDYRAEELIRDQFRSQLGRSPTEAELREAYAAVKGGGQ